jgi:hypothetical protein
MREVAALREDADQLVHCVGANKVNGGNRNCAVALRLASAARGEDARPMSLDAVTLATLSAAALELGFAGYYARAAYRGARLWLPAEVHRHVAERFALDRHLFRHPVPAAARRQFVLAHVFASIGFACLTVLAFAQAPFAGGLVFAAVTALAIFQTAACWRKLRRADQAAKVSPPSTAP